MQTRAKDCILVLVEPMNFGLKSRQIFARVQLALSPSHSFLVGSLNSPIEGCWGQKGSFGQGSGLFLRGFELGPNLLCPPPDVGSDALRENAPQRRMFFDPAIELWLSNRRIVHFAVTVTTITN